MHGAVLIILWGIAGIAVGAVHVWMIRRALSHLEGETDPYRARRLMLRRIPLRLLALMPILLGAVLNGLPACLGLVMGLLIGRLAAVALYFRSSRIA